MIGEPDPDRKTEPPGKLASAPRIDGGIPLPLTPLIGRVAELAQLDRIQRSRATRLLVLTGPGGVGKTRLAVSAARAVADAFSGGVVMIDLSPLTAADAVLPAIASAIGVHGAPGDGLLDAAIEALRGADRLLVLDNFEQVVDAAPTLTRLLTAAHAVTMMVTSRSVLGVYGETVFPVSPFSVPDREETSFQKISQSDAVRLFVQRVQAVRPRFHLTERNAPDVVTIVNQLDGIPLAIELAAARTSLFSLSNLAERLQQQRLALESGLRNVPDRFRTMRNAIGWSYDLLSPFEQQVFRQLSVFVGAWSLDAAAVILFGTSALDPQRELVLLDAVGSLVDKSLVQRVDAVDHDRTFRLLQVLREYGLGELEASGEREAVEERHTRYIMELAARAAPRLTGRDQVAWLNQLDALEADITAVFERLMATDRPGDALELITAIWRYGYARRNILEFRARLEQALDRAPARVRTRAVALNAAGVLSNMLSDFEATRRYHEEALEISREIGDTQQLAVALFGLGDVAATSDNDEEAETNYLAAERLYTEMDQTRGIATAQTNLGNLYWKQGKLREALKINEAARRLYESVGDQRGLAWSYTNVGRLSAELREYGHAAVNLSQALALYDLLGDRTGISETLEGYALISIGMRDYDRAARLLGAADAIRVEIDHPVPANDMAAMAAMRDVLRKEAEGYEAAFEEGRQMDAEDAISLAMETSVPLDTSPRMSISDSETRAILERLGITERELEVLQKLGSGETDREIAERLYISARTVQTHVQNLLNKFEVSSRSAAVAKAFRIGLLH